MDWSYVLRSLQSDFIKRLADGCLLHCESIAQYSELTVISGDRLKQLRNFCWVMAEKYKRVSLVRDVFISYLKGKLGEEVVKERLADFITEVDYEKRFGGDGNIDFTLTNNPLIGIEVKSRHGNFDKVRWSVSVDEVQKNAVIVCVLIQEEVNEAQSEYHLVLAGFLPTEMIKLRTGKISFGIEQLFYAGGLRCYLEHLQASTNYISPNFPGQQLFNKSINQNFVTQVKIEENSNQVYIQQGDECWEKQLYDAAIENYSQALQIHHGDANTYYKRGNVFYCLQDYQKAIADYIQAININPNFAKAYIKSGLARYQLADYYGAIEDYTQAIRINSYDAVAFQNRGDVRSIIGDSQGAIEDYTQARKINPLLVEDCGNKNRSEKCGLGVSPSGATFQERDAKNTEERVKKGLVILDGDRTNERKNHQRAIEVFTQVIEISPNDAVGYKKRGNARCDLGDYRRAIEDFTKAIQINPYDADAYFYRGNAFYELGDKPEAIADYTQAIKINPNDADAYINRGNLRDELGDTQGAVADFQVAADLYQKAGKVQEHKDTREKILDLEIEESLDVLDF
ncbi:tetratricopeptide repeat protein [Plectonema cf. radiosum LEGE 06105]|uniref:Tetratricopeptide repeat protein n=1 Tax=Plectonema cf. radiosum LEGE 06105 TaxID=945769 RepID=A0A8J7EZS7_9CYAN|nr:tetratricopeptide repeat protein [Plectonema radiosum]MBE9211770.1 tetratricopeptide repeat protein [Plectonema cf. radiosum LEGE 06105]